MKRKLLICSSLITLLLSVFSVPIFAEETVQDSSTLHSLSDGVLLDQYFYDNYESLPYLQSDGNQYIDTGIKASDHIKTSILYAFTDLSSGSLAPFGLIDIVEGSTTNRYYANYFINPGYRNRFAFGVDTTYYTYPYNGEYDLINISFDHNLVYLNNDLVYTFQNSTFTSNNNIYLFSYNYNGIPQYKSPMKLYKFSIYDYSLNDGEGGYLRYYYPARSKSSNSYGLYDVVSKTFFVSPSSTPFSDPTNQYIESFHISTFITSSLGWIGQIFTAIIQIPIIVIFMAIGLAGAMFRWGRRIVHF